MGDTPFQVVDLDAAIANLDVTVLPIYLFGESWWLPADPPIKAARAADEAIRYVQETAAGSPDAPAPALDAMDVAAGICGAEVLTAWVERGLTEQQLWSAMYTVRSLQRLHNGGFDVGARTVPPTTERTAPAETTKKATPRAPRKRTPKAGP